MAMINSRGISARKIITANVQTSSSVSRYRAYGDGFKGEILPRHIYQCIRFCYEGMPISCFSLNRNEDEDVDLLRPHDEVITQMFKYGFLASDKRFYSYIELLIGDGVKPAGYDFRRDLERMAIL